MAVPCRTLWMVATLLLHPQADAAAIRVAVQAEPGGQPQVLAAVGRWAASATDARYRLTPHANGAPLPTAELVPAAELASGLADCVRAIRSVHYRRELTRVKSQISEAERARQFPLIKTLMDEQQVLLAGLRALDGIARN